MEENKKNNEFDFVILAATSNQRQKSNFLKNNGWEKVKVEFNKKG